MAKLPSLDHVKYVKRGQRVYAYFNTGKKVNGKPVYKPLPQPGSVGFYDSYTAFLAGRNRQQSVEYTVAAMVAEWQRSPEYAAKAVNTRKLYDSQLLKIVEHWGAFPADDLQREDIRIVLEGENWGAGTHNMVLAVLGSLYTWGRKRSKTTLKPSADFDRKDGGTHEPWPDDVLEAALASDDATIRLLTHLLYFTGLRINDALALRWGQIKDGTITVMPSKTARFRKRLYIPLAAELAALLDETPKRGLWITAGIEYRRAYALLKTFAAGFGFDLVPHGLRKNAVISLLENGCTIAEAASITGQTYQVVEHYAAEVNMKKLGKAAMLKFDAGRQKSA